MKKLAFLFLLGISSILQAQTESDGIRMSKGAFCGGLTYNYSAWTNYWEGTFRRDNENIGRLTSSAVSVMGAWGVLNHLNVIFSLPYVATHSSAGTLKGQQGIQDFTLFFKWLAFSRPGDKSNFQIYGVLGGSTPLNNYIADFLPMSIGLKSSAVNARLIGDFQVKKFFITASGSYVYRFNIKIDRTAYYTDRMIYSNEVFMPNGFSSKLGTGYRNGELIIEGVIDTWNTLGGFDIRKNDMPFPSNRMNMARTGINLKIPVNKISGLSFVGNSFYTFYGRNTGQAISGTLGIFYIFN
ncbi:MAG TPA: hypothetical protein VK155_08635 [Bacteroidales bacterium]|nr:hypothetical protein [Bacteroidales bacterium]